MQMPIIVVNNTASSIKARVAAIIPLVHDGGWFSIAPGHMASWARGAICKVVIDVNGSVWSGDFYDTCINVHGPGQVTTSNVA